MYKVVIVDDEQSVRERLISLINRMKEDYEIIATYENGYDALFCSSLNPDILLSTGIRIIETNEFSRVYLILTILKYQALLVIFFF